MHRHADLDPGLHGGFIENLAAPGHIRDGLAEFVAARSARLTENDRRARSKLSDRATAGRSSGSGGRTRLRPGKGRCRRCVRRVCESCWPGSRVISQRDRRHYGITHPRPWSDLKETLSHHGSCAYSPTYA